MRDFFESQGNKLLLIFVLGLVSSAQLAASVDAPSTASPLDGAVRAIFERSCSECHDAAQRSRPKGDFGYVLDLDRLKGSEYIVPGKPEQSELYEVLIEPDPDLLMPPPDSNVPALTPEEIQSVHAWILSLGGSSEGRAVEKGEPPLGGQKTEAPNAAEPSAPLPESKPKLSLLRVFARAHPMLVHFPIALLLVGAMAEVLGGLRRKQKEWLPVMRWALAISSLSSVVAVAAGWLLAGHEGYKPETVSLHRWLGVATALVAWVGWGLLEWSERTGSIRLRRLAGAVVLLGALLVSLTGHTGGELVYGEGYPFR